MRKVPFLGSRGVMALALASGVLLAVTSDSAGQQKSTTGGLKKSTTPAAAKKTQNQEQHHHPSHIHAALHELKEARHELLESHPGHDFGGRKHHAIKAIDYAIHELELLLPHHPQTKKK
jgi:hypothetical protein